MLDTSTLGDAADVNPVIQFLPHTSNVCARNSSRDGHAEGEHVNRGRDTPSFCPTLQVLDMSTLGDATDVNPVIKFLSNTLWQELHYRIDICRVTKGGRIEHL